jgi:signal transduction histidine kinase
MAGLVSTLLDSSRIQLGSFAIQLKEVNIIQIAEKALNQIAPEIYTKGIRLLKEYDQNLPLAMSDASIIRTILHNILSNAVKYTPNKGMISFKVKKEKKNVLFQVSDSGWGIPREEQPRIFSKYFRAQNIITRDARGSGLGLYLTKQLINSIQGKIWFSSSENKGTTFNVSLPLARETCPDYTLDRCSPPTEEPLASPKLRGGGSHLAVASDEGGFTSPKLSGGGLASPSIGEPALPAPPIDSFFAL